MEKSARDYPIAMNINFDSVNCAQGFPEGFDDPSYFQILDRFLEASQKYGFKYSIFVIGRDLENPEVAARVRDLSAAGHEIGNHTWSHPLNLGALPVSEIEAEILKTHEIVAKITGKEPRGFVAPNWSTSSEVYRVLSRNAYLYDCSTFPSILFYALMGNLALNFIKDFKRLRELLRRKDWFQALTLPVEPFFINADGRLAPGPEAGAVLALPLPSLSRVSPAFWHTVGFVFGWKFARKLLGKMLSRKKYFYYLVHPADLIGREDLDLRDCAYLARMDRGAEEKRKRFEEMIDLCAASGREIITLEEMAERKVAQASSPA